jgi:large subunit ribosomal protein L10
MAISKDKKQALVAEFNDTLTSAKMVVAASYDGVSVADLQALRREARDAGVTIRVIKNRLVRVAMSQQDIFASTDTSLLRGRLLYAASSDDEVAPAQVIAGFTKKHKDIELKLVAGFDASGTALDTVAVNALADLPTKDQLRGMVVSTIAAPLTQLMGVLNGSQRGFTQVLSQRAEKISA